MVISLPGSRRRRMADGPCATAAVAPSPLTAVAIKWVFRIGRLQSVRWCFSTHPGYDWRARATVGLRLKLRGDVAELPGRIAAAGGGDSPTSVGSCWRLKPLNYKRRLPAGRRRLSAGSPELLFISRTTLVAAGLRLPAAGLVVFFCSYLVKHHTEARVNKEPPTSNQQCADVWLATPFVF